MSEWSTNYFYFFFWAIESNQNIIVLVYLPRQFNFVLNDVINLRIRDNYWPLFWYGGSVSGTYKAGPASTGKFPGSGFLGISSSLVHLSENLDVLHFELHVILTVAFIQNRDMFFKALTAIDAYHCNCFLWFRRDPNQSTRVSAMG